MKHQINKSVYLFLALCLLVSAGCATPQKNYVVLLSNEDGQAGAITVTNEKGSRELDRPGYAIGMDDTGRQPSEAFVFSEEKVQEVFGETIKYTPEPSITFILYFTPDTIKLTRQSQEDVKSVLSTVTSRKFPTIAVTGHTDRMGPADYNAKLALERAEKVEKILIKAGITARAIEVSSHGENNPLIATADNVSQPKNRRVEVIVR